MKIKEIGKKIRDKAADAKDFYRLHRSSVNGAIAALIGGTIGTVAITKALNKGDPEADICEGAKGDPEADICEGAKPEEDPIVETYYDRLRVFNIDGKEVSGLYQYLGSDGVAIWLDTHDQETRELDKHFREDNENAIN